VTVPAGAVPDVSVSDGVRTVIGASAPRDAGQMAEDLVADLLIESDALREGDPALAATALAGPRLEEARREMADGADPPPGHTFSRMTVVIVRDPEDPQAVPRFGIRATGTSGTGAAVPFDRVFVLQEVDGVWLLTDELAPSDT
jgi:hypothetical protein